jgi:hypothetical protein
MWVRIRSWHIVDPRRTTFTLCGRVATGARAESPPSDEATCETCFRVAERRS